MPKPQLPVPGVPEDNARRPRVDNCICGSPDKPGVVHRFDGPCYIDEKMKQRLPPGSRKVLDWNGTDWKGVLTVPGCPEFRFVAGSERRCEHGLDDLFRLHVAGQTDTK